MAKGSKARRITLTVIAVLLALLLLIAAAYFIMVGIGKSKFHKDDRNISTSDIDGLDVDEDSVTYKGKQYVLNGDVISVLFLGIDKDSIGDDFGVGNNGQADTVFVMTLNTGTKAVKLIPIPRETMVDVNVYSASGKYSGTKNEQLCLAYAYGKDAAGSSQNTKLSVSRILLNINVSNYITMDLKGISAMTDAVGGITLTAIEDIPEIGCKVGQTVNLRGADAQAYLQSRTGDIDGSSKRLERQKQFLSAFVSKAGNKIMGDFGLLRSYYDKLGPYISTDLSYSQIVYLVSNAVTKDIGDKLEYKHLEGETKIGEKWVEFYPDSDSLVTTILDTFYIEKQ